MTKASFRFVENSDYSARSQNAWKPVRVPAEDIDREIERVLDIDPGLGGIRAASIVHPESVAPGLGFAPGVEVTINVLKPGESTRPMRRNSNQLEFCLSGAGTVRLDRDEIPVQKWDVVTIPSMRAYAHRNNGKDVWVWLSYSNAALLEKLGMHYVEELPDVHVATAESAGVRMPQVKQQYNRRNAADIAVGRRGARMRGYEFLTDIEVVENKPLHWPWREVQQHVTRQLGDGRRGIMLLYNPATERRNGTTHSFFATISSTPAGSPPRPQGRGHRHSSVAINYHFEGAGRSTVDGEEIEWRAGDLLLSAPAWSEHAHFVHPQGSSVLTVQDHPLHIGMESLIWQERMDGPILTLGSEAGQTGYVGPRIAGS
jgi:gentisate 1,2-dioxygenase